MLTILVIGQIAGIVFYFAKKDIPRKLIKEHLANAVHNYVSLESEEDSSLFLGIIMPVLKCCGYTNGEDFKKSGHFSKRDVYDRTLFANLKYPIPCCKMTDKFYLEDNHCPTKFTGDNSYIQYGCEEKFEGFVFKYLDIVCYITIVLVVFQLILIVCTAVLLK
ncbi:unnamed protein product [Heterobilharzia americana]|nr:unnamed protein product [Heterobilharzia americana]